MLAAYVVKYDNIQEGSQQLLWVMRMYEKVFKRLIDILISACGALVLMPLFALIALMIKLDSRGPVLFRQKRVGRHKTHFGIFKFRTMRADTPKNTPTHLLSDPDRYITRVGRLLRKTSLDELPQLINILLGQMAVVGPRPALWNQFDLIDERDKYGANDVLPGLTGWAQVNGRDELAIADKARLDGEYIQKLGFGMDLRCIVMTIANVITGTGVVEGDRRNPNPSSDFNDHDGEAN